MGVNEESGGENSAPQNWIELHRHITNNWLHRADNAWETIKLNTILSSALISLTIYSIIYVYTSKFLWETAAFTPSGRIVIRLALVSIPITMFIVNHKLHSNFHRQCRRLYKLASIVMKIEERLGLYSEYREQEHFSFDKWYVPNDWKIYQYYTSDKYVRYWMNEKDAFYRNMAWLFKIFERAAVVLACIEIVLVFL